jgi:uncharacterized protein (DUF362 family)/Pyruvate/2-oxoacid:ferredoxin oxidoreductase delta subunit
MKPCVAIQKCPDYKRDEVFEAIHHILELLGGIGRFVEKGQTVLLKPNMLSAKEPERGITTHPMVLEAMIREVRSVKAEVWIGDSPSGAIKGIKRYYENTGYRELADRMDVRLVNFEAEGTVVRQTEKRKYHLAKSIFEVDVIINLPKFKTHGFTLYTGAIKNVFGTLPGLQKANLHKRFPHPKNFSSILVDLYSLVKPTLHVMDGILGMEGNGPATGDRRQTGLLLGSEDGVALDAVASHLMGFGESEIDAIRLAGDRGLGENRLEKIQILGAELKDVKFHDFSLPSNRLIRLIPAFIIRWMGRLIWVRPYADLEKCTGCAICEKSCPVKAIQMVEGSPVTDYRKCINCLCCNESCPEEAIIQQLSWLSKRLG